MAAEWVEIGKEILGLAVRPRYSFTLWVVSLLVLLVPLPEFLRLDTIRQDYGQYIGLVCLIMFVVWLVEMTLIIFESVKALVSWKREEKKILMHLDTLNSREAHLLLTSVANKIQTVLWRQDADEVSSLVAKGLLSLVPDNSTMFHKPYTIPRFVWDEITNPGVIEKMKQLDKQSTAQLPLP